jgi:hypothetical protein
MQGGYSFDCCMTEVAVLTGLRHLELCLGCEAADTLRHLAPLVGLTSLRVQFSKPIRTQPGLEGDEAGGPGDDPTTMLAHLGALSGLTRIAQLSVRDWTPSGRLERVPPSAALLAALPSSPFLTEVRPGGALLLVGPPPCMCARRQEGGALQMPNRPPHTMGTHATARQGI